MSHFFSFLFFYGLDVLSCIINVLSKFVSFRFWIDRGILCQYFEYIMWKYIELSVPHIYNINKSYNSARLQKHQQRKWIQKWDDRQTFQIFFSELNVIRVNFLFHQKIKFKICTRVCSKEIHNCVRKTNKNKLKYSTKNTLKCNFQSLNSFIYFL